MGYKCPNTPLCFILLLTFYFMGDIPFHPLPLMFKWTRLWTWIPKPLGLRSSQKGVLYSWRLCLWPWRICPLHNMETPYGMHTQGGIYKPKVRQFDVGDFVYFQWQPNDILDTSFGRTILRIKVIMPLGVLELQGTNGCTLPPAKLGSYHHHVNLDSSIWLSMSCMPKDKQCW
jgi:hypothetical protein